MGFGQTEAPLFPSHLTEAIEPDHSQYESVVDSIECVEYPQTKKIEEDAAMKVQMCECERILSPPFYNVNSIYPENTLQGQQYDDINNAVLLPLRYPQTNDDINEQWQENAVSPDIAVQRLQVHDIKFPTPISLDLCLDDLHSDGEYQEQEHEDVNEQMMLPLQLTALSSCPIQRDSLECPDVVMQTFYHSPIHQVQPRYNWGMANEQLQKVINNCCYAEMLLLEPGTTQKSREQITPHSN